MKKSLNLSNKKSILKVLVLLLSVALLMGLLSGCVKDYTKRDVIKYLREELELRDFRIVSGPKKQENTEGYTDEWWTVTTNDYGFDEPLVFHVINHTSYSLWSYNYLMDDMEAQIFKRLSEEYQQSDDLRMVQKEDYFLSTGAFETKLDHREDFEDILPEVERFQEYVRNYPKLLEMSFRINYIVGEGSEDSGEGSDYAVSNGSVTSNDADYDDSGDYWDDSYAEKQYNSPDDYLADEYYSVSFTSETSLAELHNKLYALGDYSYNNGPVYNYLADCLFYGNKDRIADFSDDEVSNLISWNNDLIEIRDQNEMILIPNLVYCSDSKYISMGHFYDLLKSRNIPVSGDWTHYSFTGKDGISYEFGYDLPYVQDSYWYVERCSVPVEDASKMLGIELDNGLPNYEVVLPLKPIEDLGMDPYALKSEMEEAADEPFWGITVEADGIHIKGKAYDFTPFERANDDRITDLRDELRYMDPEFQLYTDNLSKTYEGVTFSFSTRSVNIRDKKELFNEIICRTIINQLLDNPDTPDWNLEVAFKYQVNDKSTEERTFNLPEQMAEYQNYIENGFSDLLPSPGN